MRRAVLLGAADSKRTQYLKRAAQQTGLSMTFLSWENWQETMGRLAQNPLLIKIDPPVWDSCILCELDSLSTDFKSQLNLLAQMADSHDIRFFNHPSAVLSLLDKVQCKETLRQAGLPVTEILARTPAGNLRTETALHGMAASGMAEEPAPPLCHTSSRRMMVENAQQLLEIMRLHGIHQVFVKPVNGSGAAGVSAFRHQTHTGRMALYTCAVSHPSYGLVNTKRLRYFSRTDEILSLLDQLLQTECVIERWHPKADYQGYSYDLRAVVQDGRVDYLLARLSKGPITNLHLNNRPLDIGLLGLASPVLESVAEISVKAARQYPGLVSAGIDILLERGSLLPRIIEMNGQGDLIYQDIYHENTIYRHQAELIKRMEAP